MQTEPGSSEPGDNVGPRAYHPGGTESAGTDSGGTGSAGTVSVTGTGLSEAAPDLMVVSVGVECRAGSVEAAYSQAGTGLEAVASAFRQRGVKGSDIRTTGLNVRADLEWREGEGQRVTGYVAAGTLSVRLRALGSALAAISEAVDAGGNDVRLNGLELTFSDDAPVRARAREAAWLDALNTAQQYARLASARLGRVLSVADGAPAQNPVPVAQMQRVGSLETLAVEAGDSAVGAAVSVVWELLPGGQAGRSKRHA